jgi:hypothetical protein
MCVLVYDDCSGSRPPLPLLLLSKGGRVHMEDQGGMIVQDSNSISTCPIYKIWFYIYLLNRLGYGPPIPLGRVGGWSPYSVPLSPSYVVPDNVSSPECLASELYPNVLDIPVSTKLPSALLGLRLTHRVLPSSGRVLNDSDQVSSIFLKT